MRKLFSKKTYLIVKTLLICVLIFSSCTKTKETSIKKVEDVSEKAEEITSKAEKDTNYLKSEEYVSEIQKLSDDLEKKTFGMTQTERDLVYFESSLRMLKKHTEKRKTNPSLSKNKDFMRITSEWGIKVRDYNISLRNSRLTPEQKKKFEDLNSSFNEL